MRLLFLSKLSFKYTVSQLKQRKFRGPVVITFIIYIMTEGLTCCLWSVDITISISTPIVYVQVFCMELKSMNMACSISIEALTMDLHHSKPTTLLNLDKIHVNVLVNSQKVFYVVALVNLCNIYPRVSAYQSVLCWFN